MRSLYLALNRYLWVFCLTAAAVLPMAGCGINSSLDTGETTGELESLCGNGKIEKNVGEQCDGKALGGETCESLGEGAGKLACGAACFFDVSLCEGPPRDTGVAGYGSSNLSSTLNSAAGAGGATASTGMTADQLATLANLAQTFFGTQATGGTTGNANQATGGTSGNQQGNNNTAGSGGRQGRGNQGTGGAGQGG